jgi:hypothetical protein
MRAVGPCLTLTVTVMVVTAHDFDFDPEGNRSYGSGIMLVVMMVVLVVKLCRPIHWTFLFKEENRLGLSTATGRNSGWVWHRLP